MSIIPTVKIKSDGPKGFRIINESAFDPDVHERFGAVHPVKQSEPAREDPIKEPEPIKEPAKRGRPKKQ